MGGLMSMVSRLFPYHATSKFADVVSRPRSRPPSSCKPYASQDSRTTVFESYEKYKEKTKRNAT